MRLGFAVAIHSNFDIFLADEILAVGDQRFQAKCLEKFRSIRENGKTLIFVSHSFDLLTKHCERGLLLGQGSLIQDGPIADVCRTYTTH